MVYPDNFLCLMVHARVIGLFTTVLVIIKLTKNPVPLRMRCGSGKFNCVIIPLCFAIFKNVVYRLEPGETPSYSASQQASNYVQRT